MAEDYQGFGHWADQYRLAGFWPRPVKPGTKAAAVTGWTKTDDEFSPNTLRGWSERYASAGIGLRLGSPFSDGTKLVALDIDRDEYTRLGQALLHNSTCGRIGARGVALFARMRGDAGYREFKIGGSRKAKVGELLGDGNFCVLPPTIHPLTNQPYRWIGPSLLEVDYRALPLIEG